MVSFTGNTRRAILGSMVGTFVLLMTLQHFFSERRNSSRPLKEAADIVNHCDPISTRDNETRIPDTIHQIWKDDDVSTYSLEASRDTWRYMFAGKNYTIKLWTESDILKLVENSYPWLLSTYKNYQYDIQRADIARLMVVHKEGGIYADLDAYPTETSNEPMECLQRLEYQALFAPMVGNKGVSNHFFMGQKDSEFLLWALHEAKKRATSPSKSIMLPYVTVLWSTGPIMITAVANEYSWLYNQSKGGKALGVLDDRYVRTVIHHAAGRYWHGADGFTLNFISDYPGKAATIGLMLSAAVIAAVLTARRWRRIRSHMHNTCCPPRS